MGLYDHYIFLIITTIVFKRQNLTFECNSYHIGHIQFEHFHYIHKINLAISNIYLIIMSIILVCVLTSTHLTIFHHVLTKYFFLSMAIKGFFKFQIIITVLVSSFRFIRKPILWAYGHYNCYSMRGLTSVSDVNRRHILISKVGTRTERVILVTRIDYTFKFQKSKYM